MEKFRRRRSKARVLSPFKVTTIIDRSSDDSLITIPLKENQLHLKSLRKLGSDYSSRISDTTSEQTVGWGRSSSGLSTGTTMKKLLADEMLKETESKRQSPSLIARLMGLDGLPAQQSSSKQQKRISENNQRNAGSTRFRKSGNHCEYQSHRKSVKAEQQFKDVYEVAHSSNMETSSNTSQAAVNPNASDVEMAFIKQKFMDVKRFSSDEKLQHSKEFHDALEVLDSNKDILLKFLQEPDSFFSKHLHGLHGAHESYCGHVSRMKSRHTLKSNIDAIGCQSERERSTSKYRSGRETTRKIDISHYHEHWDSCYGDLQDRCNLDSRKLNSRAEGKQEASLIPTRIVVLKPNLGKSHSTGRSVFSPSSSQNPVSDVDLHDKCSNVSHAGYEVRGKRSAHNDFENYECKPQESGDLARDIARRMRNKLEIDTFSVSSSGYKGYSADESSCDTSENQSAYESEVTVVSSRTSFNRSVINKASTSNHSESAVNREAKRRLSQRWKMTCRSQEFGASGKGSTLAEMLDIPELDIRPRSPDSIVAPDEYFHRFRGNDGTAELIAPLGISSRDGWKDDTSNLSRSRSLPASSYQLGSPKSSTRREALAAERFLVCKESIDHQTNNTIKKGSKRREGSFPGSAKCSVEKLLSSYPASMELFDDVHEVKPRRDRVAKSFHRKDSSEIKAIISEMSSCGHDSSLTLNTVVDNEPINISESLDCSDQRVPAPEILSNVPSEVDLSTCDLPSVQQFATTHPECRVSSEESEQPSPVSVLEATFVEDISSGSECFERVSAELHGLRKQLQLLKMESKAYDEGSMHISSDEDVESFTELHDCQGFLPAPESWESSYLEDVLNESGLDISDSDLFLVKWHSPDCPIGSWVFENLEKKYGVWESCSRSERRLLFDCVNSRIIEISQHIADMYPWAKQLCRTIGHRCQKDVWIKTEVHKLLENNEKKATEIAIDKVILDNMQWPELGEHIDTIGRDIEELLIDELVAELFYV